MKRYTKKYEQIEDNHTIEKLAGKAHTSIEEIVEKLERDMKESTFSAITELDKDSCSDVDIIRIGIASELSAINLYNQLATYARDEKLRQVLLDIAYEEKVHVGEFESILDELDSEQLVADIEGESEVEEM